MNQPGRAARLRKAGLPGAEVVTLWRIALRWVGYGTFTVKASARKIPPGQGRAGGRGHTAGPGGTRGSGPGEHVDEVAFGVCENHGPASPRLRGRPQHPVDPERLDPPG